MSALIIISVSVADPVPFLPDPDPTKKWLYKFCLSHLAVFYITRKIDLQGSVSGLIAGSGFLPNPDPGDQKKSDPTGSGSATHWLQSCNYF